MPTAFSVPALPASSTRNEMLRTLEQAHPDLYAELDTALVPVSIPNGTLIQPVGEAPTNFYFIESGVVSVVAETAAGETLEIGIVGAEGITNVTWMVFGSASPSSFVAQLPVCARQLTLKDAQRLLLGRKDHPLHGMFLDYTRYVISMLVQSGLCARFHTAVERLARWLLLTRIRTAYATLPLTHEALARMVGAPRSQVSEAIATLRQSGCIGSSRGATTIVDADALRRHACECLASEEARLHAYKAGLPVLRR